MSAIAWWVLPILATLGAIVYVTWRGRPQPPEDTHEAIEAREKFRRAMEKTPDAKRAASRRPRDGSAPAGPDGIDDPSA